MRIAIAGTTGLIGHAISLALAGAGHSIVSVGRRPGDDVPVDLADPRELPAGALEGCELLVHAAGVTDEDFADPDAALRKARRGAEVLATAAVRANVPRLAYISSAHVYGPLAGRIDEDHPVNPASDYARAHQATESVFAEASDASGAALLVARPCAVFGMPPSLERFARWSLIPFDFPRQALGGEIVLKSSGLQRRNFVSSEGVARLVGWWLETERAGLTVANAPGKDEMTVFDFARLCARIAEEESGEPCAVTRPDATPPVGPPLEFLTRVGGHLPGVAVEDHVRALVRALSTNKEAP